jgi:hypothetical protein
VAVAVASQRRRQLCHIVLQGLHSVAVAVVVAWLDDDCGRWWWWQRSCRVVLRWLHGMAWQLQLHGLTVAVAGGGGSGHGCIMEAAVVVLHCVAVAAWHGGCSCMA